MCLIAATLQTIWKRIYQDTTPYLDLLGISGASDNWTTKYWFTSIITAFGTWILLFTNMVPISLMVTLELVKFFQSFFICWDTEIFCFEKDMETKVQSSNLNEELGQVKYVFSDKTGTLTCNIMDFKKFSAGIKEYG